MPVPQSETELTAMFSRLGASDPAGWAHSQVAEGIPQLLRFLFLKGAWRGVKADGDTTWIGAEVERASSKPDRPYAGLGLGLKHCLDRGVDPVVLNEMMRCAQAAMIFHIGYMLDESPDSGDEVDLEDVSWGLFQFDHDGHPQGTAIAGLHESVLETDPTGREMRPSEALLQAITQSR